MNIQERLDLLKRLSAYMLSSDEPWMLIKERAARENAWFNPEFIDRQVETIATKYLNQEALIDWISPYRFQDNPVTPKNIGIIMAGNIPLAGFHDFLAVFISGHNQTIKTSSKDAFLIPHLVDKLIEWDPRVGELVQFSSMLKSRDAYIATGSNNSARYFDYYFSKYPHIIRRNRTSAAILTGDESEEELSQLADDVYLYFGLGCRNVTKIYVPQEYNFELLLKVWRKYDYLFDHNKYKNNYDYQLAILLINGKYYMTNGSIIMLEDKALFTAVSVVNYEYYDDIALVKQTLLKSEDIQAIAGKEHLPFGELQSPGLTDFADGINTLQFLRDL